MKRLLRYVLKGMTTSLVMTELTIPSVFAQKGEGQTLPASVWRARYVHVNAHGNTAFDSKSEKTTPGYDVYVGASVAVLEYGLTDKLTIQTKIPFQTTNALRIGDLENSSFVNDLIKKIGKGLGQSEASFLANADKNKAVPLVPIPETGEKLSLNEQNNLRAEITQKVRDGLKKVEKGPTGLGDIEVGALYNWYKSDRYLFSTGLGVRLPTGKHNVPKDLRPLGSGMTEAALRVNADYTPLPELCFSLQHQFEHALHSAKWKRSSMLDPSQFNTETPLDGRLNETTIKKSGFTHTGLAKIDFGLAALSKTLKAVSINTHYDFKSKAPTYLADNDTSAESKRSLQHSLGGGISLDGLAYGWPVGLDVDYNTTVAGRDMELATSHLAITAKAYARF